MSQTSGQPPTETRPSMSMRIITTEHTLEKPVPGLDVTNSVFRRTSCRRVPVLHLFGTTTRGERMCMHVHGVFPYVYVALEHEPEEAYLQKLAQAVDKAVNLSLGRPSSYTQHVFSISVVHGIPYYGFHHKTSVFLKIYIYNPLLINRLSDLLLSGAVMGRSFQPHEAHIPYILQFFIDYNLYGMNYINLSASLNRRPVESASSQGTESNASVSTPAGPHLSGNTQSSSGSQTDTQSQNSQYKVSVCHREVDVLASDILNRLLIDDHVGANPGLLALWEDERRRLRSRGLDGEIDLEAPESQERSADRKVGIDPEWYERFISMVDALEIASEEDRQSFVLPSPGEGDRTSLNLSDDTILDPTLDGDVNEQSISEMLSFNANLTQAAEQMSCRKLAELLAEHSDSDPEEFISYSPKVTPIKADVSAPSADRSMTYSPVLSQSPRPPEDTNLNDTTLIDDTSDTAGVTLSGASEERPVSGLSGSFTSQGSKHSASSLYRWNKKWSQESRTDKSDTRSPTPQLSQSRLVHSNSQSMHSQSPMGQLSQRVVQSQNSLLFSDDEDEEDWILAACSDQLGQTRSGFDDMYTADGNRGLQSAFSADSSSDDELETTVMTQPVWETAADWSDHDSEGIPQVDGAEDSDDDVTSNQETFQVKTGKRTNPLKLTFSKSISQNEAATPVQSSPPATPIIAPLKLKFKRTSANDATVTSPEPSLSASQPSHKPPSSDKPKLTLSFKSLAMKMSQDSESKKKDKSGKKKLKKEKSHKKEKHKEKKPKKDKDRYKMQIDTQHSSLSPLDLSSKSTHVTEQPVTSQTLLDNPKPAIDAPFSAIVAQSTMTTRNEAANESAVPNHKTRHNSARSGAQVQSATETSSPVVSIGQPESVKSSVMSPTASCLPKLTLSKKGKHFAVSEKKVSPLKLKIPGLSSPPLSSSHTALKSPPDKSALSPLKSPAEKAELFSDLTLSESDDDDYSRKPKTAAKPDLVRNPIKISFRNPGKDADSNHVTQDKSKEHYGKTSVCSTAEVVEQTPELKDVLPITGNINTIPAAKIKKKRLSKKKSQTSGSSLEKTLEPMVNESKLVPKMTANDPYSFEGFDNRSDILKSTKTGVKSRKDKTASKNKFQGKVSELKKKMEKMLPNNYKHTSKAGINPPDAPKVPEVVKIADPTMHYSQSESMKEKELPMDTLQPPAVKNIVKSCASPASTSSSPDSSFLQTMQLQRVSVSPVKPSKDLESANQGKNPQIGNPPLAHNLTLPAQPLSIVQGQAEDLSIGKKPDRGMTLPLPTSILPSRSQPRTKKAVHFDLAEKKPEFPDPPPDFPTPVLPTPVLETAQPVFPIAQPVFPEHVQTPELPDNNSAAQPMQILQKMVIEGYQNKEFKTTISKSNKFKSKQQKTKSQVTDTNIVSPADFGLSINKPVFPHVIDKPLVPVPTPEPSVQQTLPPSAVKPVISQMTSKVDNLLTPRNIPNTTTSLTTNMQVPSRNAISNTFHNEKNPTVTSSEHEDIPAVPSNRPDSPELIWHDAFSNQVQPTPTVGLPPPVVTMPSTPPTPHLPTPSPVSSDAVGQLGLLKSLSFLPSAAPLLPPTSMPQTQQQYPVPDPPPTTSNSSSPASLPMQLPVIQQGLFRKKKKKHKDKDKKRPHGSRNVPGRSSRPPGRPSRPPGSSSRPPGTEQALALPKSNSFEDCSVTDPLPIEKPQNSPVSHLQNENLREPIKLTLKKQKSNNITETVPSASQQTDNTTPSTSTYGGQDLSGEQKQQPESRSLPHTAHDAHHHDYHSDATKNHNADITVTAVESVTKATAQMVDENYSESTDGSVESPDKVSPKATQEKAKSDIIEKKSALPRPRSLVDRLSMLSQVLGVAPSDRQLDELPVDVSLGKRDRFGRPMKKGKLKVAAAKRSELRKQTLKSRRIAKMPVVSSTKPRTDRPRRIPNRFLDDGVEQRSSTPTGELKDAKDKSKGTDFGKEGKRKLRYRHIPLMDTSSERSRSAASTPTPSLTSSRTSLEQDKLLELHINSISVLVKHVSDKGVRKIPIKQAMTIKPITSGELSKMTVKSREIPSMILAADNKQIIGHKEIVVEAINQHENEKSRILNTRSNRHGKSKIVNQLQHKDISAIKLQNRLHVDMVTSYSNQPITNNKGRPLRGSRKNDNEVKELHVTRTFDSSKPLSKHEAQNSTVSHSNSDDTKERKIRHSRHNRHVQDVKSTTSVSSLQKQSKKLLMRSRRMHVDKHSKSDTALSSPRTTRPSRNLVVRSAHLPSNNDGRVTLTLRRSVLTRPDFNNDDNDTISEGRSASPKTPYPRSKVKENKITEREVSFEATCSYEADSYARKFSLKYAVTFPPSTDIPLTIPPTYKENPVRPDTPREENKLVATTITSIVSASGSTTSLPSSAVPMIDNSFAKPASHRDQDMPRKKTRGPYMRRNIPQSEIVMPSGPVTMPPKPAASNPVSNSTIIASSADGVPVIAAPNIIQVPQQALLNQGGQPVVFMTAPTNIAPKTIGSNIAPKPSATTSAMPVTISTNSITGFTAGGFPQQSLTAATAVISNNQVMIIIPAVQQKPANQPTIRLPLPQPAISQQVISRPITAQPPRILAPQQPLHTFVTPPVPPEPPRKEPEPEDKTINHGFQPPPEQRLKPFNRFAYNGSKVDVKAFLNAFNKPSLSSVSANPKSDKNTQPETQEKVKNCTVKISPLMLGQVADVESGHEVDKPILTRTAKLRSTRSRRNIKGIIEDNDFMLKRFLAMPEVTDLSAKKPRYASSLFSDQRSDNYCAHANNDWQVCYEDALQSGAMKSDSENSIVDRNICELGDSSHATEESQDEMEGSPAFQKHVHGNCDCLDCVIDKSMRCKGDTIFKQGLNDPISIENVLQPHGLLRWGEIYASWRADEAHNGYYQRSRILSNHQFVAKNGHYVGQNQLAVNSLTAGLNLSVSPVPDDQLLDSSEDGSADVFEMKSPSVSSEEMEITLPNRSQEEDDISLLEGETSENFRKWYASAASQLSDIRVILPDVGKLLEKLKMKPDEAIPVSVIERVLSLGEIVKTLDCSANLVHAEADEEMIELSSNSSLASTKCDQIEDEKSHADMDSPTVDIPLMTVQRNVSADEEVQCSTNEEIGPNISSSQETMANNTEQKFVCPSILSYNETEETEQPDKSKLESALNKYESPEVLEMICPLLNTEQRHDPVISSATESSPTPASSQCDTSNSIVLFSQSQAEVLPMSATESFTVLTTSATSTKTAGRQPANAEVNFLSEETLKMAKGAELSSAISFDVQSVRPNISKVVGNQVDISGTSPERSDQQAVNAVMELLVTEVEAVPAATEGKSIVMEGNLPMHQALQIEQDTTELYSTEPVIATRKANSNGTEVTCDKELPQFSSPIPSSCELASVSTGECETESVKIEKQAESQQTTVNLPTESGDGVSQTSCAVSTLDNVCDLEDVGFVEPVDTSAVSTGDVIGDNAVQMNMSQDSRANTIEEDNLLRVCDESSNVDPVNSYQADQQLDQSPIPLEKAEDQQQPHLAGTESDLVTFHHCKNLMAIEKRTILAKNVTWKNLSVPVEEPEILVLPGPPPPLIRANHAAADDSNDGPVDLSLRSEKRHMEEPPSDQPVDLSLKRRKTHDGSVSVTVPVKLNEHFSVMHPAHYPSASHHQIESFQTPNGEYHLRHETQTDGCADSDDDTDDSIPVNRATSGKSTGHSKIFNTEWPSLEDFNVGTSTNTKSLPATETPTTSGASSLVSRENHVNGQSILSRHSLTASSLIVMNEKLNPTQPPTAANGNIALSVMSCNTTENQISKISGNLVDPVRAPVKDVTINMETHTDSFGALAHADSYGAPADDVSHSLSKTAGVDDKYDSDETCWSGDSDWLMDASNQEEVDIVYGTPPEQMTAITTNHSVRTVIRSQTTEIENNQEATTESQRNKQNICRDSQNGAITPHPKVQSDTGTESSEVKDIDQTEDAQNNPLYTSVKRLKTNPAEGSLTPANIVTTNSSNQTRQTTSARYQFSAPPPSFSSVEESSLELGLSIVENIYPFFSNKKDCELARNGPMAKQCLKRFDDKCPEHLPSVILRLPEDLPKQYSGVTRFEKVKPPPSRNTVEKWLHYRQQKADTGTNDEAISDNQKPPTSAVADSDGLRQPISDASVLLSQESRMETSSMELDPTLLEEMDVIVPESPPFSPDYADQSVIPATPPTPKELSQKSVTVTPSVILATPPTPKELSQKSVTVTPLDDRTRHSSATGAAEYTHLRPTSKASTKASYSQHGSSRPGSRKKHHDLFSTQIIQSLNASERSRTPSTQRSSRRSSAFGDKPTDHDRTLMADHSLLNVTQADMSTYSPLTQSLCPSADQSSVNLTRVWSHDKSSIEGLSGIQDRAAETHQLLKDMASHNTAHNDMITMCLELHINTRGTLYPDPALDEVQAIFVHLHHDLATSQTHHYVLVSLSDSSQNVPALAHTVPAVKVVRCHSEADMLENLVKIVRKHDPDLLVGWEVHNLSWGYLLRRARSLQMNLSNDLSRIPQPVRLNMSQQEVTVHSSEFNRVGGRVLVNMWKVMRHQMHLYLIPSLTNYNFENVVYHTLNLRVPKYSYQQLTDWYTTPKYRIRVINYYTQRVSLLHNMEQQIDFIGQTSEFARVYGIEFCDVVAKGSQYKVESMMLRIAKPLNFVAVSPNIQQRVRMNPPECIPLTLEPQSHFYADPVIVLDFQSLYPSIMIAYNYCFSTCLGHVSELERAGGEDFKFGCTSLRIPAHVLCKLKDHINVSPNGVAFVKQHVRKGVISRMVEEILDTRLMVKRCMSRYKSDKGLHKLLHARQLGLKLIANVTFGYTAANFSGRMPCVEVGDSIVRKARETLEHAIKLVNESERWNCRVVYGDTDSLFVQVPGRNLQQAFKIGEEIRDAVTAANPKPIKLKLEKVYMGCVLQTKKRYAGYMYETADQKEPVFDAKGIETVRRDSVPAVTKILQKSLTMLFATRDLSQIKSYIQKQLTKILDGSAKLQDFIFSKEYRGERGYKPTAKVPALLIAKRRVQVDVWSEHQSGERVPYVIVCGAPGTPLYHLVREPQELLANPQLKLNTLYYVNRIIIPPLHRALSLLGVNVQSWYEELPRINKITNEDTTGKVKSTLPQYFSSAKCLICEGGYQATICHRCLTRYPEATVVALNNIVGRQFQQELHVSQICRACSRMSGSDIEKQVACISLDCPVLYKRTQLTKQRDLSATLCEKYLGKINNY